VRHLTQSTTSTGRVRYLMGMEFLTTSGDFSEAVDRLIAYRAATPVTAPPELA
jgi:hypothetical protein